MAEQVKEKEASAMKTVAGEKRQDPARITQKLEKAMAPTQPRVQTRAMALFGGDEAESFRARWTLIQTGFVDEPQRAVEQADALVRELTKRLSETFASEQAQLERQWGHADNLSTEDLRVILQRYHSFFGRLLSI